MVTPSAVTVQNASSHFPPCLPLFPTSSSVLNQVPRKGRATAVLRRVCTDTLHYQKDPQLWTARLHWLPGSLACVSLFACPQLALFALPTALGLQTQAKRWREKTAARGRELWALLISALPLPPGVPAPTLLTKILLSHEDET